MTEREIIKLLAQRYVKMLGLGKDQHLRNMCLTMIDKYDTFPEGKLNRWLGYVQRAVIDMKLTTLNKETKFTRPLFDKLYGIPEPIEQTQTPNE
jgi:hypothetical protein